MTRCGCTHDESRHDPGGGHCAVTLPRQGDVPAWRCPCRRFVASRTVSLLLRSVQSCTVQAADLGEHTRSVLEAALQATGWEQLPRGA